MPLGTVRWFDPNKGYGFIAQDGGGRDVFVHHSVIEGKGFKTLVEGERVEFEMTDEGKGPRAVRVVRLSAEKQQRSDDAGQKVGTLGALLAEALGKRAPTRQVRGGLD